MKTSIKIIAIAATALAAVGTTLAHPGGMGYGPGMGMGPGMGAGMGMGPGMGPGMGRGMGMGPGMGYGMGPGAATAAERTAFFAERMAALKAELKITPAQEQAWTAFQTLTQQHQAAMQALRDQMHAQMQANPQATPADFAALRETMFKQRQADFAARDAALKDLYAVLTPEQKTAADRWMHFGPGAGRGWRMGRGS